MAKARPMLKQYAERYGFGRKELQEATARVKLLPRQRLVLALRSGFAWFPDWTLDEVAALEGVTRERIRQAEARMCRKIWWAIKTRREAGDG